MIRGGMSSVYARQFYKANNKYLDDFFVLRNIKLHHQYWCKQFVRGIVKLPLAVERFFDSWKKSGIHTAHQRNLRVGLYSWSQFDDTRTASRFLCWFPLAPSREVVGIVVMSNEQVDMLGKLGITTLPKVPKRLQTLHPKEDYVLHYLTLKLYHEMGVKITHLGKILQFRQSHWMATFVDLNTRLRKAAVDKNSRGSISSNDGKNFTKNSSEHNEKLSNHWQSFSQNRLFSNKNFVGQTYDSCCDHPRPRQAFHVSVSLSNKKKPNLNLELLYSDTDSFIYTIKTDDVYRDLEKIKTVFDFSN